MTAGGASQRWRKERPTEPGWYWWRNEKYQQAEAVNIILDEDGLQFLFRGDWRFVNRADGEWQGPITPHDQEAG